MVPRPYEDLFGIPLKGIIENQIKEKIFASWILRIYYLHGKCLLLPF